MLLIFLVLAFGCLFSHIPADTLFFDNFEEQNYVSNWNLDNGGVGSHPWLRRSADAAFNAGHGISISADTSHRRVLIRGVNWPATAKSLADGIVFSFRFRLHKGSVPFIDKPSSPFITLFGVEITGTSGAYFSTPIVLAGHIIDSARLSLTLGQRTSSEANGQVLDPGSLARDVLYEQWYALSLFLSIRGDTLIDSLFIDNAFASGSRMVFTDKPVLLNNWRIGADYPVNLPIGSIDFDDACVSSRMPKHSVPEIWSPTAYACLKTGLVSFVTKPLPKGNAFRWLEICISDTNGNTVVDSQFIIPGPYIFGQFLDEKQVYTFKARYIDTAGIRLPWSQTAVIYIDSSGTEMLENPVLEGNAIILRPSRSEGNSFHAGDTISLEFLFNGAGIFCVDLGIKSAACLLPTKDRYGAFDSLENYVFSINSDRIIFSKKTHGTSEWTMLPKEASEALVGEISPERIIFHFPIKPSMRSGIWTINASLVTDKPASISGFSSVFFRVTDPGKKFTLPKELMFVLCLVIVLVLFIVLRKSLRPAIKPAAGTLPEEQSFPVFWTKTADDIDAFLRNNYTEIHLNRDSIAEQMHMEDWKLTEIYQKVKGKSPLQRLRDIRMEKAAELLKTGGEPIADIAFKVGFDDPHIFQRNFKKYFGATPSNYRKQS